MARPKKNPLVNVESNDLTPKGVKADDALPIIKSIAIVKSKGLYGVAIISSQGDKIDGVEMVCDGDAKSIAQETFKIEAGKLFWRSME